MSVLEMESAIAQWNHLLDSQCVVKNGERISDDRISLGNNIIIEGAHKSIVDPKDFVITRCIFILRPSLAYSNELPSLGSLQNFNNESIFMTIDINLNGSPFAAANSAIEKGLKIQKSMLSDIYGNQTLLLEVEERLGLEFRTLGSNTPDKNHAQLFLMYLNLEFQTSLLSVENFHLSST